MTESSAKKSETHDNRKWLALLVISWVGIGLLALDYFSAKPDETTKVNPLPTNTNPDLSLARDRLSKASAKMVLKDGTVRIRFFPQVAPNTVNRFIELVNRGFYNGLIFHHVEPGFLVQTGDPNGNGTGGSGKKLQAEFSRIKFAEGIVGMARGSDPHSADSQFFVLLGEYPHLNGLYTGIGKVVEGLDLLKKVAKGDVVQSIVME